MQKWGKEKNSDYQKFKCLLGVTPVTKISFFIVFSSMSTQVRYGEISKAAQFSSDKEHLQFINEACNIMLNRWDRSEVKCRFWLRILTFSLSCTRLLSIFLPLSVASFSLFVMGHLNTFPNICHKPRIFWSYALSFPCSLILSLWSYRKYLKSNCVQFLNIYFKHNKGYYVCIESNFIKIFKTLLKIVSTK